MRSIGRLTARTATCDNRTTMNCSTCDVEVNGFVRLGECNTCARYRHRNGSLRPKHLIERARTRVNKERPKDKHPTVYIFRDVANAPLYVGVTARGLLRIVHHASICPAWWRDAVSIELIHCATATEAKALEARLIRDLDPLWNEIVPTPRS